jgi:thioredoxin 1
VSTVEITEDNIEEKVFESDQPWVLDLWAPWCGPCKTLGPIIEEFAEEYEGEVHVGKINVDEEPELAQAFNVQGIPLVVAMKGDEPQDHMVGFSGDREPVRELFEQLVE